MSYLYGTGWDAGECVVVRETDEAGARVLFTSGPRLAVIAGPEVAEGQVPVFSLALSAGGEYVDVTHYDPGTGSVVAIMGWRPSAGRLFLTDVTEYLYEDDGAFRSQSGSKAARTYLFVPSGEVTLTQYVAGTETREVYSDVDVSTHWADPVGFGDWDRLGTHELGAT